MSENLEKKNNHNELPQNPEEKELSIEEQLERAENEGLRIAQIDATVGKKNVEQGGGTELEVGHAEKAGEELVDGVKRASRRIPGSNEPDMAVILHKEDLTPEEEKILGIEIPKYEALALTAEQKKKFHEMREGEKENEELKNGTEEENSEKTQNTTQGEPQKKYSELRYTSTLEKRKKAQAERDAAEKKKTEREAWLNLAPEERLKQSAEAFNKSFGKEQKAYWESLTEKEREEQSSHRFKNGKIGKDYEKSWEEYWAKLTPKDRLEYSSQAFKNSKFGREQKAYWENLTPEKRLELSSQRFKQNKIGEEYKQAWEKYWASLTPRERLEYSAELFKRSRREDSDKTFGAEQEALKPRETVFSKFTEKVFNNFEKVTISPLRYLKNKIWKEQFLGVDVTRGAEEEREKYKKWAWEGYAELQEEDTYPDESSYREARLRDYPEYNAKEKTEGKNKKKAEGEALGKVKDAKSYSDDKGNKWHYRIIGIYANDGKFTGKTETYKIYDIKNGVPRPE